MKRWLNGVTAGLFAAVAGLSFAQPQAPSDAQIVAIVVAANGVDIDAGKLAKFKSRNNDIKEFAQRMISDHTGVNKQATALMQKLNLTPEESQLSNSIKRHGAVNLRRLDRVANEEFDKAYIDNEVTFHQALLDMSDKTLLPNAKNEELKGFLEKLRPTIDAHLRHAKQVGSSMK